ncbi:MAG: biopolymer transporter ExbD [Alcanivoracaceae bacterium]|nr:biopolymer transporter ExbD [Alcanivoracaceae bacterium]
MRRKRSRISEEELNITTFLNLMVVLIPFLLLNAVFAQVSILQLNLPSSEVTPPSENEKPKLALEVLIYKDRYEVADRTSGSVLKIVRNTADGAHDADGLRSFLAKEVKSRFEDITSVTLLCEDDTPYDLMIRTMDSVRYYRALVNGQSIKRELFPDIGIGSAPADSSTAGGDA